jgi:hypothetical protein
MNKEDKNIAIEKFEKLTDQDKLGVIYKLLRTENMPTSIADNVHSLGIQMFEAEKNIIDTIVNAINVIKKDIEKIKEVLHIDY